MRRITSLALTSLVFSSVFALGCATTSKNSNALLGQLNRNAEGLYGERCSTRSADHAAEVHV